MKQSIKKQSLSWVLLTLRVRKRQENYLIYGSINLSSSPSYMNGRNIREYKGGE